MSFTYKPDLVDSEWGCAFSELDVSISHPNIKVCFVRVENLLNFSNELSNFIHDNSWMMKLDKGSRRQYDYTVKETAALLIAIFKNTVSAGTIAADFGELMVSIGSARGLEQVLGHIKVPLAELWKPQAKQNEGFDFHTICTKEYVNFGEAKYSAKTNPHGLALKQAQKFIEEEKHFRDRGHLLNLVSSSTMGHFDEDRFGVVAAFSINSLDSVEIFKNAISNAEELIASKKLSGLYLVGVADEC